MLSNALAVSRQSSHESLQLLPDRSMKGAPGVYSLFFSCFVSNFCLCY
jgi:hypothetical protein